MQKEISQIIYHHDVHCSMLIKLHPKTKKHYNRTLPGIFYHKPAQRPEQHVVM